MIASTPPVAIKRPAIFARLGVVIIAAVLATVIIASPKIFAEPAQNQDTISKLTAYCKTHLKKNKFKGSTNSACSESKMTRVRNAASQKVDYKGSDVANDIRAQGEAFIREAAKSLKSEATVNDFNRALDRVYDKYNLDPGKLDSRANSSLPSSGNASGPTDPFADPEANCDGDNCDFIKKYVNPAIGLLSVMFGLIVILSLIMGGIQYSASQGDPQKVTKAKQRIGNTILALVAYIFLYSFLQFLIPGGLFNR